MRRSKEASHGFTLFEVIVTLVLISILAAVVLMGMASDVSSTRLSAEQEVLKADIRYAQSRAMNSNLIWGVLFNSGTYSLFNYDSTGGSYNTLQKFPYYERSDPNPSKNMPSGMTATGAVAFDFFGRPYYLGSLSGNPTTTAYTGQLSSLTGITITPDTGFVP
jgi:prepilin-type N-terminal cleavage/methylation domain-containing protein